MTSEKKTAANRRNALKSTGPKTREGKSKAALNSLRHGLRSSSLALPYLEDPEDWEVHRELVVRDLAPVGYLETVLSERVAALLWRLGRVVRYETEVVSIAMKGASEGHLGRDSLENLQEEAEILQENGKILCRVRAMKPAAKVSGEDASMVLDLVSDAWGVNLYAEDCPVSSPPGIPEEEPWECFTWWTRALVEKVALDIRDASNDPRKDLFPDPWGLTISHALGALTTAQLKRDKEAARVDTKRREALLPADEVLEKVSRYETTLERSLFRTLHELQRLQAGRSGVALLPPAAVDVDLSVHQEAS